MVRKCSTSIAVPYKYAIAAVLCLPQALFQFASCCVFPCERVLPPFSWRTQYIVVSQSWSASITLYQNTYLLYKALIFSVLLYAAETWTILVVVLKTLEAFHFQCHRKTLWIRRQNRIRNADISLRTGLPSIGDLICKRGLLFPATWPGYQPLRPQLIRAWSCRSTSFSTDFLVPTGSVVPTDLWRYAVRGSHSGATLWSSLTTRLRRQRRRSLFIPFYFSCLSCDVFRMCYRHFGDLGNVEAVNGVVDVTITDRLVTLFGEYKVIGLSFVVSIFSSNYIL